MKKNPPSAGYEYLVSGNYSRIYKNKDRVEVIVRYKDACRDTGFPHYDASREIMISVRELATENIKKFLPEIVRKRIDTDKDGNLEFIYEMPLYKDNYSVTNDDESSYIDRMIPNVKNVIKPTRKELQKISSMIITESQKYPNALFRFDSEDGDDSEGSIEGIVPFNLSVYNGILILRDPIAVRMNSIEFIRTFSDNFNRKTVLARYLFSSIQE